MWIGVDCSHVGLACFLCSDAHVLKIHVQWGSSSTACAHTFNVSKLDISGLALVNLAWFHSVLKYVFYKVTITVAVIYFLPTTQCTEREFWNYTLGIVIWSHVNLLSYSLDFCDKYQCFLI